MAGLKLFYWYAGAGDDNDFAMARKQPVGDVEVVTRNQNVSPIFFDERTASITSGPISDHRSQDATDCSSKAHGPDVHFASGDQITRKGHDDLGWQRYACRFDRHQENNTGVTHGGDGCDDKSR